MKIMLSAIGISMHGKQIDQYSVKETERRLQRILHGAFAGPPTPLKDIPKKNGESRAPKRISKSTKPRSR
jgi:hypothetical protein